MLALVDSDTPIFAAAISSEGEEEWVAISRLDMSMHKLLEGVKCDEYRLYVSGGDNFRYGIYPLYKKNRGKSPEHREACKQHLINKWGAIETDGYEADDAVGCEQDPEGSTVIVGIDKDLLMVPGNHYQWPITRKGEVIRPERRITTSPIEGMRLFFTQCLTGDTNDNIGTYLDPKSKTWKKEKYLLGPKGAEKLLAGCTSENQMYQMVKDYYTDVDMLDVMHRNMDLLWVWREYGYTYSLRRGEYGTL